MSTASIELRYRSVNLLQNENQGGAMPSRKYEGLNTVRYGGISPIEHNFAGKGRTELGILHLWMDQPVDGSIRY